ncbi:hypothetical protein ACET3Z_003724 [Daucus carota]
MSGEEEYEVRTGGSYSSSRLATVAANTNDYVAVGTAKALSGGHRSVIGRAASRCGAKNSRRVTRVDSRVEQFTKISGPVLVFNLTTQIQFIIFNDFGRIYSNLLLHRISRRSGSKPLIWPALVINIEKKITIDLMEWHNTKGKV